MSSHGLSSKKVDYLFTGNAAWGGADITRSQRRFQCRLYALAIRFVWSTLARDAAQARVRNEARWIDFQFTSDSRDRRILVQQQRGDLLVYDLPVVVFVGIVAEQCLDVFGEPAEVGVLRLLDVRGVAVRDRDVQIVGLCLMVHLEVFDLEGKLFHERLRVGDGGAGNQQYEDSCQGAGSHHRVLSFVEKNSRG